MWFVYNFLIVCACANDQIKLYMRRSDGINCTVSDGLPETYAMLRSGVWAQSRIIVLHLLKIFQDPNVSNSYTSCNNIKLAIGIAIF